MKRKCKIIGKHLLLAFLAFIWLIPIIWLFVTSLSGYKGINTMYFSRLNGRGIIMHSCSSDRIRWRIFQRGFAIP